MNGDTINIIIFIISLLSLAGLIVWLITPSDWVPPLILFVLLVASYILYIVLSAANGGVAFQIHLGGPRSID